MRQLFRNGFMKKCVKQINTEGLKDYIINLTILRVFTYSLHTILNNPYNYVKSFDFKDTVFKYSRHITTYLPCRWRCEFSLDKMHTLMQNSLFGAILDGCILFETHSRDENQ